MSRPRTRTPLEGRESWLSLEDYEREYHLSQFQAPLGYTSALVHFLATHTEIGSGEHYRVLDVGTGAGANLLWLMREFPACSFVGIDINRELLDVGRRRLTGYDRIELQEGDALSLGQLGEFDFVLSFQVLSWLDMDEALQSMREQMKICRLGVAATALTSGRHADYLIEVRDRHAGKRKSVTIFAEDTLEESARAVDWKLERVEPFSLATDLPDSQLPRELFTRRMADGSNLVFAGDVYLPQACVLFEPFERGA